MQNADRKKYGKKDQTSRTVARLILLLSLFVYAVLLYLICAAITDAYRPSVTLITDSSGTLLPPAPLDGNIDINAADMKTLQTLPGIGEKYSQAIVEYRAEHGGFDFAEDLMNVRGIAEKRFEAVLPYITLGEYQPSPFSDRP